jgi:riboflavin kinase/FMN adenylyltransferase
LDIITDISGFQKPSFAVVTVGTFDGIHIGHQAIIGRMKEIAESRNGETILVTFDPHPRLVLNNNKGELRFINTRDRKFALLEKFGIDRMIIIPFTIDFAKTSSEDFTQEILVDKIGVDVLIVGYDHHFGRNREGNYEKLIQLGNKLGFNVEEIPARIMDGVAVSSTKIRKALADGNVRLANRMLGYSYSITGKVVSGNKLGRTIGFPTANIDVEDKFKLIAAGGVYFCKILIDGEAYFGMGNIGTRPTVGIDGLVTEVHIFDFEKDIYGKEITLCFLDRIRDEQKFDNMEKLREQLVKDRETAKRLIL